ncbi:MAG: glycogen-binding domain-containing protein, partial [Bacteroidetes bacterium]|nr:glycogen-binding domain-containing protein [Bacteroidota bacterium]
PESDKMQQKGNTWTAEVESEPGKVTYKFIVDGLWITDPENKKTEKDGGYSNSVLVVTD